MDDYLRNNLDGTFTYLPEGGLNLEGVMTFAADHVDDAGVYLSEFFRTVLKWTPAEVPNLWVLSIDDDI